MRLIDAMLERGWIPDALIRSYVRAGCRGRVRADAIGIEERQERFERFIEGISAQPLAVQTALPNEQHYEVPTEFFRLVLGARLKYSCCLFGDRTAAAARADLDRAEERMLDLTCERAALEDGQEILELGCGWGSLSLYMAERYPRAKILALSNSRTQREYIEGQAASRGLTNLTVVTADMKDFTTDRRFDRVVSVEMFEHMRNYRLLF